MLLSMCDGGAVDLVLTTGGTGLSPRDVTPEATLAVIEREAQGISEYLRHVSVDGFPRAALSRGVAGVRASTLIVNLPGSTSGVVESLVATYGADIAPWLGGEFALVTPYLVMMVVLLVRPYGLFGTREVIRI